MTAGTTSQLHEKSCRCMQRAYVAIRISSPCKTPKTVGLFSEVELVLEVPTMYRADAQLDLQIQQPQMAIFTRLSRHFLFFPSWHAAVGCEPPTGAWLSYCRVTCQYPANWADAGEGTHDAKSRIICFQALGAPWPCAAIKTQRSACASSPCRRADLSHPVLSPILHSAVYLSLSRAHVHTRLRRSQ
jgi:hypothetical protein